MWFMWCCSRGCSCCCYCCDCACGSVQAAPPPLVQRALRAAAAALLERPRASLMSDVRDRSLSSSSVMVHRLSQSTHTHTHIYRRQIRRNELELAAHDEMMKWPPNTTTRAMHDALERERERERARAKCESCQLRAADAAVVSCDSIYMNNFGHAKRDDDERAAAAT